MALLTVGDQFPEFNLTALKGGNLREANAASPDDYFEQVTNNSYEGKWKIVSKKHITFNMQEAEKWKSWVVFSVEKNRAGRAEIDLEFQLISRYFCFNPNGGIVEQTLIDEKVIDE